MTDNCKYVKYLAKDAACATRTHANLLFYVQGLEKKGTVHLFTAEHLTPISQFMLC